MGRISIARRPSRRGLIIARAGSRQHPNLLFPLYGVERGELDDLVRAILAKGGVTDETEVQAVVEKAEQDAEVRIKVAEARAEVRRLMKIRQGGGKLIAVGFRKWKQAFFPAHKFKDREDGWPDSQLPGHI